jgi:O-methyltransferase
VGEDSVVYVKGYFPETVSADISQRRYAIVHLDCDLYGPMKAGLEFFYDRLSPGGIIIIHDYANPCWKGVKQAVDEFQATIPEGVVVIPDKSGTAIIRKSRSAPA